MAPTTAEVKIPVEMDYDEDGFVVSGAQTPGIYAAGCVKNPLDVASAVRDATATALKAIQSTVRGQQ
jgi:quinone-modifying oxidoreductase subunit QmoA